MARNIKSSPEGELKSLFTPLCKLFIGTLDVVAAADEVAGAFAVVDAGSGIVVSLGHAARKFLPWYPFPAGGPDGAHRYGRRCT